jgi:Na+/H+ antiporter NhaD/arsenite permease-like protein
MEIIIIAIFILGYLGIAFEHNVKIDKLIPALGMMAILWALIAVNQLEVFEIIPGVGKESHPIEEVLLHHLGKTAEILFFLMGAMTIVEIIDYFDGFSTIKSFVKTKNKVKLLWLITTLAFILYFIISRQNLLIAV